MADLENLFCMTEDCSEKATTYCCICRQLFCETHNKAHRDFVKILCSTHEVISVEEYQAKRAESYQYCSIHEKTPIVLACENCYVPMCPKYFDDKTVSKTCKLGEGDKHCTRTVEQVAEKIRDEISELLSELKVTEMTNADELKERRKQFDEQMDDNRAGLDKLDTKVQELHDMINDFTKETREKLVSNMKERKVFMAKWEGQLTEHQTSCQQTRDMTARFMKSHDISIVKDQQKMKDDLIRLKSVKLETDAQILMSLTFKDEPLNIPIKLNEVYQMPTGLEFKQNIAGPGGRGYSVQYVEDGRLLHSGTYQITGLSFTPNVSTWNNWTNYSLCEHGSNLYVLQYYNNNYHVHILHMKTQTTRQSVIQFPNNGYQQQIAVNDAHIAISNYSSNSVKIYSTVDNSHVLDIKHQCIGSRPWGVAIINNTIVVGDRDQNQVSNLTISTNPIVKWTCTEIDRPSAIRVCDESRVIMVASFSKKKVHILSYKGEKLSTLDVPECQSYIWDFAVYGKELAIADTSTQIKLYKMKAE